MSTNLLSDNIESAYLKRERSNEENELQEFFDMPLEPVREPTIEERIDEALPPVPEAVAPQMPQAPVMPEEDVQPEGQGRTVASVAEDVVTQAVAGVRDAVVTAMQSIHELGNWMRSRNFLGLPQGYVQINIPDVPKSETIEGRLTRSAANLVAGLVPGFKFAKALGVARPVARGALAGVVADMAFFDPRTPRVSDWLLKLDPRLQAIGLRYLATDPNDTLAEAKLKAAIEGLGIGTAADVVFLGFKALKHTFFARDTAFKAGTAAGDEALVRASLADESTISTGAVNKDANLVAVRQGDGFADLPRPGATDLSAPPRDIPATEPLLLTEGRRTTAARAAEAAEETPVRPPIELPPAGTAAAEAAEEAARTFPRARELPKDLPGVQFPRRTMRSQFEPKPVRYGSLRETPDESLEFKQFVRKHGGIKLAGEELSGELGAIIRRTEGAPVGILNDASGISLQRMADIAQESGFTRSANKEEVLDLLDRSVRQEQDVLSMHNPGVIMETLNNDPLQAAMYYKVKALAEQWDTLVEGARRGVMPRAVSHERARELMADGEITFDYIRQMSPGAAVNAEQASAIVQTHVELMELIQRRAQDFMREPDDKHFNMALDLLNMFGETDPKRLGMMAESGRALGIFNDPLTGFKQYLAQAHDIIRDAPNMSKLRMMEQLASMKSVQELADLAKQVRRQSTAGDGAAAAKQLTPEQLNMLQRGVREAARVLGREVPEFTGEAISGQQLDLLRQAQEAIQAPGFTGETIGGVQQELLDQASRLIDLPPGFTGAPITGQQLSLLEDAEDVGRVPLRQIWTELWYNSMLSAPAGRVADLMSMSMTTGWAIPERFLASAFTRDIHSRESLELLHGAFEGFFDAMTLARRAFTTGERQFGRQTVVRGDGTVVHMMPTTRIEGEQAINVPGNQALSAEALRVTGPWAKWVDYLGNAINLPRRSMLASDEFFRMINYRMELRAQTYRQAMGEVDAGVLDRAELGDRMARLMLEPTADVALSATNFAHYNSFTTALTQKGGAFEAAGRAVQFFSMSVQQHPALQLLFPFIKTPFNLARFAGERSPLGLFSANVLKDLGGVNGGAARGLASAKMALGSMLMGGIALMAQRGLITGHGPDNARLRAQLRNTQNWQEYSIRVGDTWFKYNRFDPLGMMIGGAADIAALMGEVDEFDAARLVGSVMQAVWNNLGSKTYLRQASELFDALVGSSYDGGQTVGRRTQRFVQRFMGSLLVPSAVAGAARTIDPVSRETGGRGMHFFDALIRGVQARVPGWSGSLPARRNLWGEEMLLGMGWHDAVRNPIASFVAPMYIRSAKPLEPIDRMMLALGYVPSMPQRVFRRADSQPVELTPEEYDRYVQLSAGHGLEGYRPLKTVLNEMVTRKGFMESTNNFTRENKIREVIFHPKVGYRAAAKAQLLRESPALVDRLNQQITHQQQQRAGQAGEPLPEIPLSLGIR